MSPETSSDQCFSSVESDHPPRIAIFARHEIVDDGFQIGLFDVGFSPDTSARVETVLD
jgi:hypothetical protein